MFPILLLMGFAPYFPWQTIPARWFYQKLKMFWPILAFLCVIGCYTIYKEYPILSILGVLFGTWIFLATLFKVFLHFKRINKRLYFTLPWSSWGMLFGHAGIAIAVLGISLLTVLKRKRIKMSVGETLNIDGYDFIFQKLDDTQGPNYEGKKAEFLIKSHDKVITHLYPEKRFFIPRQLAISETAIYPGFLRDFYVALGEKLEDENWSVRLYIKPFIRWIWLGGLMIAVGAGISGIAALRDIHKIGAK